MEIDPKVIEQTRSAVCAIGWLDGDPYRYTRERALFKVIGTGFLVDITTVMTNRHVLKRLLDERESQKIPEDRLRISFAYAGSEDGERWKESFCQVKGIGLVDNANPDIGFIEFARRPEKEFEQCTPLQFGDLSHVFLGQHVAAFGFPYGNQSLTIVIRDPSTGAVLETLERFGPLFQRGHISATVPFGSRVDQADRILLDIRIARGMSGSPLLDPISAKVIGIIYAGRGEGVDGTVFAVGVPIDKTKFQSWFRVYQESKRQNVLDVHSGGKHGGENVKA